MRKATTKSQIRFWENNINPITGWVENKRDEHNEICRRAALAKRRAIKTFSMKYD